MDRPVDTESNKQRIKTPNRFIVLLPLLEFMGIVLYVYYRRYRTEINRFLKMLRVTISIRMSDLDPNYPSRTEFSIGMLTYCMNVESDRTG